MIEKRKQVSPPEADTAGKVIARFIPTLITPKAWVAGYIPLSGEANVLPALEALHKRGNRLALPKVDEPPEMLFLSWKPGDELVADVHSVLSPARYTIAKPDIWLVPLVAFDEQRYRLGYGAGYYDRAIVTHVPKWTIGIAYSFQAVDKLPVEAHDMPLDVIVTEKGIL